MKIFTKTLVHFIELNLLWQLLEFIIYHEVQPRTVDTIIAIPILILMYQRNKYKELSKN